MPRSVLISLAAGILGLCAAARGEPMEVEPNSATTFGQTTVYRADVTGPAVIGTIHTVLIRDLDMRGGSSGVFSGFDLDFVMFDKDGDPATTDDQYLPRENHLTKFTPGVQRKGADSPYQPTAAHPGPLFGTRADGSVDWQAVTLGTPDASYRPGRSNLSVDTSSGWLSLGDGGQIEVEFPLISIQPDETLYLLIGEVGPADEKPDALTRIQAFVSGADFHVLEQPTEPGVPPGVVLSPGEAVNLNALPSEGGPEVHSWRWDLDGDGEFDEGFGPALGVSYEYFTETLGLSPDKAHQLCVEAITDQGPQLYPFVVTVPGPATCLLLAAGAPILMRRRRRRG
ncbi:MAG: hypothetical protein J7M21_01160 [Planctomycetes bacterium]|nr:hypothetical protein [Planctomycetota bacterium]